MIDANNNSIYSYKNAIGIFQHEAAATCSSSKRSALVTDTFGPCYVVAVYHRPYKIAAMAHLDDKCGLKSIDTVLNVFKEYHIPLYQLEVAVMGGWKDNQPSNIHGECVLKYLKKKGVRLINLKNFQRKSEQAFRANNRAKTCFEQASIDARTGKVSVFDQLPNVSVFGTYLKYQERWKKLQKLDLDRVTPIEMYADESSQLKMTVLKCALQWIEEHPTRKKEKDF